MGKDILLISDIVAYGELTITAMQTVLTQLGHHSSGLPTALVSNTFHYGKFAIIDTTDYLKQSIEAWNQLGFSFDAIATGYIVNLEQARMVAQLCREQAARGAYILCDPIMGDDGVLYDSVTPETVEAMKDQVAVADCIVPNYTEAAYLAGMPIQDGLTAAEADELILKLRAIGAKSVVVTSAKVDGQNAVIGYDAELREKFILPFELIPVVFRGTGDIFSAIVLGHVLDGWDLKRAVKSAVDSIYAMISRFRDNKDKLRGLPLASCLDLIER